MEYTLTRALLQLFNTQTHTETKIQTVHTHVETHKALFTQPCVRLILLILREAVNLPCGLQGEEERSQRGCRAVFVLPHNSQENILSERLMHCLNVTKTRVLIMKVDFTIRKRAEEASDNRGSSRGEQCHLWEPSGSLTLGDSTQSYLCLSLLKNSNGFSPTWLGRLGCKL